MFKDLINDLNDHSIVEPDIFLDVPFVPSDDRIIDTMLQLAQTGRKDILYDLGCGDGRIVIAAAKKYRCTSIGVELDPLRVADAMEQAGHAGVEYLVDFVEEDLFTADFSQATIVTLYLMDTINAILRPRLLQELRPGARIVSHAFDMGDWEADEILHVGGIRIYKWIVPAQVAGEWEWEGLDGTDYRLQLKQRYQDVSGKIWMNGKPALLTDLYLSGDCLELSAQADAASPVISSNLYFDHQELLSVEEVDEEA